MRRTQILWWIEAGDDSHNTQAHCTKHTDHDDPPHCIRHPSLFFHVSVVGRNRAG
jgi:hypothetical protein